MQVTDKDIIKQPETLDKRFSVRLSKKEHEQLLKMCKKSRVKKSTYVRHVILKSIKEFQAP